MSKSVIDCQSVKSLDELAEKLSAEKIRIVGEALNGVIVEIPLLQLVQLLSALKTRVKKAAARQAQQREKLAPEQRAEAISMFESGKTWQEVRDAMGGGPIGAACYQQYRHWVKEKGAEGDPR